MRYSLSSEMSLLSEKGKGGLKSLCMAAVSQFSEWNAVECERQCV